MILDRVFIKFILAGLINTKEEIFQQSKIKLLSYYVCETPK